MISIPSGKGMKQKRLLAFMINSLMIASLILSSSSSVFAQEVGTPVPDESSTSTPVVTEVPTSEPSLETTIEPTLEPTIVPTFEPTLELTTEPSITPEVIPTETILPTDTPTENATPTELPTLVSTSEPDNYFTINSLSLSDGTLIEEFVIHGPPVPPPGYDVDRWAVPLPQASTTQGINVLTEVPAFEWVLGSSAVSGGMIAGYYDRTGYPNIYTGPTNDGVTPLDNGSWPTWSDGDQNYPNVPLVASKKGVDGQTTRGSIDDNWEIFNASSNDPYITGGLEQHTWGSAIGDYMKTSQSAFGNADGSTRFYNYSNGSTPLTCDTMAGNSLPDGTLGRKLFYEARGYAVTECYNQKTDNTISGGFSFVQYMSEIDAGRPVMLNLAGHTVVGVGYDNSTNMVYIHDTWDYSNHTMTWGGSYSGMTLQSVSIVNLVEAAEALPDVPVLISPGNNTFTDDTTPDFTWNPAANASTYEIQIDNDSGFEDPGLQTASGLGLTYTATSLTEGIKYWRVRGVNSENSPGPWTAYWYFYIDTTPTLPPALNLPADGTSVRETPTFSWLASSNGIIYEFAYGNNADCSSPLYTIRWISTLTHTPPPMVPGTYHWCVRTSDLPPIFPPGVLPVP